MSVIIDVSPLAIDSIRLSFSCSVYDYSTIRMPDRRSNSTAIIDLTASSPPRPLTDALIDAINTAPPKELRSALKRTCESSKEAWKLVKKILLVRRTRVQHKIVKRKLDSEGTIGSTDEDQSGSGGEDEGGSESEDSQEKDVDRGTNGHCNGSLLSAVKRYRPRFATCENCNEDFDVTNNDEDACVWHPGRHIPASLTCRFKTLT